MSESKYKVEMGTFVGEIKPRPFVAMLEQELDHEVLLNRIIACSIGATTVEGAERLIKLLTNPDAYGHHPVLIIHRDVGLKITKL